MRSFRFKISTATPGSTETVAEIRVEESADGLTGWATVETVAVGDLVTDGDKKRLDSTADPTKYSRLIPLTASGVERQSATVYPPQTATPDAFTLYAHTIDAGLGIAVGAPFTVATVAVIGRAGDASIVKPKVVSSDTNGNISVTVPADAGSMTATLGSVVKTIDTTGKAGQTINWADL